jgi:hypothetical protein
MAAWLTPTLSEGETWVKRALAGAPTAYDLRSSVASYDEKSWAILAACDMVETIAARYEWEQTTLAAANTQEAGDDYSPLLGLVMLNAKTRALTPLMSNIAVNAVASGAERTCVWLRNTLPNLLDAIQGEVLEACFASGRIALVPRVISIHTSRNDAERSVLAFLVIATGELALIKWALNYWREGMEGNLRAFLTDFAQRFAKPLTILDPVEWLQERVLDLGTVAGDAKHKDTLLWLRAQGLPWPLGLCRLDIKDWVHAQHYMPCEHDSTWLFEFASTKTTQ